MTKKYHIEQGDVMARWFPRADGTRFDAAITQNEKGGVRCLLLCSMEHAPMIKRALEAQAELDEIEMKFKYTTPDLFGEITTQDTSYPQMNDTMKMIDFTLFMSIPPELNETTGGSLYRVNAYAWYLNVVQSAVNDLHKNGFFYRRYLDEKWKKDEAAGRPTYKPGRGYTGNGTTTAMKINMNGKLPEDFESVFKDDKGFTAGTRPAYNMPSSETGSWNATLQAIGKETRAELKELRAGVIEEVKENLSEIAQQATRPSVLYRPKLALHSDGVKIVVSYGEFHALGDTAEEAMQAFDLAWCDGVKAVHFSKYRVTEASFPVLMECFNFLVPSSVTKEYYDIDNKWSSKLQEIECSLSFMGKTLRRDFCVHREANKIMSHTKLRRDAAALLCEFAEQYEGRV